MIAHLAGVPVEEALLPLSGAGVWLVLARGWVAARLRRRGSYERSVAPPAWHAEPLRSTRTLPSARDTTRDVGDHSRCGAALSGRACVRK